MDRFINRRIIKNNFKIYDNYILDKDKKFINQYETAVFKEPTEEQKRNVSYIEHTWSLGDRLYKLANKYLRDKSNWWIILRFNNISSEVDIKAGDIIKIPSSVEEVIAYYI